MRRGRNVTSTSFGSRRAAIRSPEANPWARAAMQQPATVSIPGWPARCHFPPQHSILRAAVPISWPFSQSQRKTGSAEEHKFALSEQSEFSKFMRCGSLPSPDFDDFPRRRVGQRWAPPPGRSVSSFRALQRTARIPARRQLGRKVTSPPSGAGGGCGFFPLDRNCLFGL